MKRWALATVSFYLLALLVLTVPMILIAFYGAAGIKAGTAVKIFTEWGYWLWLTVLVAGQALLLLLPLKITQRRFIPRRTLVVPCIVTAFLLANLFIAGIVDILCAAFDEKWINAFLYLIPFSQDINDPNVVPQVIIMAFVTLLAFWVVWTIIFRHYADSDDPESLLKRVVRWLLTGSILELLVAVPSHVIVRRRDDCCAPIGTFWGIATGLAIMLLCFGPGVFFLFHKRFKRLQPKPKEDTFGL